MFLTPQQLATLATTAGEKNKERKTIVWILGTVGLRWGELAGLKVGDIDFDRARITVQRSVTYVKKSGWNPPRKHMNAAKFP
ncbi:site-specific integrase [Corynebacterium pseudotuberculosis]|uniref:site-specific integrase n=1 Tax=Corynebacterium pseudotuberculosis TaxID=1719 RepID=UPI0011785D31|nr:site-specific integrase [Corynebacterium pseudotuberculosis]